MKKLFLLVFSLLIFKFPFAQNVFPDSGNVGIGTTSPAKKLDIVGSGINLENTDHTNQGGIIFKNGNRFISNFNYGNNGTITTAGYNTFVGINSGNFTMGSTATSSSHSSYNTAIGGKSLYSNTTGYRNTAIGYATLYRNSTGYHNTANGNASLEYNTTGHHNTANGSEALYHNTSGSYNTANGYAVMFENTTGSGNSANGFEALFYNPIGNNNVANGFIAGKYTANNPEGNDGSNNSVFIGAYTKALTATDNNEIVIGYNATGAGSNSVVLGNTSITKTLLRGNVGIGTTTPQSKLAVNGTITAQKVKVTQAGWPDYVFDSSYSIPPLTEVEKYIQQHNHLPGIPTAKEIVNNGNDLGETQAKLLQKIEELTLYIIDLNKKLQQKDEEIKKLQKVTDNIKDIEHRLKMVEKILKN